MMKELRFERILGFLKSMGKSKKKIKKNRRSQGRRIFLESLAI